jgi:small subunit ribosomal protein S13
MVGTLSWEHYFLVLLFIAELATTTLFQLTLVSNVRHDIGTSLTLFGSSFSSLFILEEKEFCFFWSTHLDSNFWFKHFLMALTLYGIPLPSSKPLSYALPKIFGLGRSRSQEICRLLGFSPSLRVADLTPSQEIALAKRLKENYTVAGQLEEELMADIHRLHTNGSQRGYRLRTGLPVRGQRTHSNAKTARRLRGRKQLR